MLNRPVVSIIVVTMNTPKLTGACLESVIQNTTVPFELIVVNNSPGQTIKKHLKKFKDTRVIQNQKNLGYTKAANQGALRSRGKYLCFLNSDTVVPPKWMERLLAAAQKPGVGAVGPVSNAISWTRDWLTGLPANETTASLIDETFQRWYKNDADPISWLGGFCLMVPKKVIDRVGPFDERFYFGWDDLDYSVRLKLKGYRLVRLKNLFVYHKKGGSTSDLMKSNRLNQDARCEFFLKWHPYLKTPPTRFLSLNKRQARPVLILEWFKFRKAFDRQINELCGSGTKASDQLHVN